MTGCFITFEGIEGSGKSTQARRLAERLRHQGHTVVLTREPGGTDLGDKIRQLLLTSESTDMDARTELLLYCASRAQHLSERIEPALDRGEVVVCDRFSDATLAYQGAGRELSMDMVRLVVDAITCGLKPDLTFLLDLPVVTGLSRAHQRNEDEELVGVEDRFEGEGLAFHNRVRDAYKDLARQEDARFCILDATETVDVLHAMVARKAERVLDKTVGRRGE